MKKILIVGIAALSIALITPAYAAELNNSGNQETNAQAVTDSQSDATAVIENGAIQDNRVYEGTKTRETKRFFLNSGEVNYPGAPNMLGGATPSYMDRLKVSDILEYDEDGITLNMALQMRQDDAFMGKRIMVREKFGKMVKSKRLDANTPMKVVYTKQADMQSLGTITVVSDSKKSVSPDVFAEIVIKAHELCAVALHVKAEGFQRLVRNEGAGIGFTWTGTTISNGQSNAMTGVMGAGKSWGEAGYFDHPFIVVHALFPKNFKIGDVRNESGNVGDWLKD